MIGRFLSADTVVPGAGNPLAFNRYAFVRNNPLKYVDPSGHAPSCSDQACWQKRWYEAHGYECFKPNCGDGDWTLTGNVKFTDPEIIDEVLQEAGIYFVDNTNSQVSPGTWTFDEKKLIAVGSIALANAIGGMKVLRQVLGGTTRFIRAGKGMISNCITAAACAIGPNVYVYDAFFQHTDNYARGTAVHELAHVIDYNSRIELGGKIVNFSSAYSSGSLNTQYDPLNLNYADTSVYGSKEHFAEAVVDLVYGASYKPGNLARVSLSGTEANILRNMLRGWGAGNTP